MKIAYILKMYPRFSETFIVNEILELERQGVDVRIYSLRKPDDGRFHASLARVRANVVYVPEYPDKEPQRVQAARDAVYAADPHRYLDCLAAAEARGHAYALKRLDQACVIAAHLLAHPVEAMHAHFATSATRVAGLVCQLTGTPYSFTAHAKDIYHDSVRPESLRGKVRDARFVVTVSRFNQAHLEALMAGEPADVRCLYNGIDLAQFRPDPAARQQPPLILGVGRLVEKKGFDVLIAACALLARWGVDFRCELIGNGDLRAALQAQIDALKVADRVRLVGPRPQEAVQEAYGQAAIFALPCVIGADGNRDGLPTVLLEAMACGLPVVSTDLTGIPEIIDHGVNGVIVPPGDALALANALAALIGDPARCRRLGAAARHKVVAAFDVRQNVAQLHAWLAETAVGPSSAYRPVSTIVDAPYAPVDCGGDA